jgi:hypothetical protein
VGGGPEPEARKGLNFHASSWKKTGARERERGRKEEKNGKRRRGKERERLFPSHLVINYKYNTAKQFILRH